MKRLKNLKLRMRSLLCALLIVSLLASSISAGSLAVQAAPLTLDIGLSPGSVTATLNENGTLAITGAGEIRDFTAETAPFENWDVKAVEIGAGISAIGDYTFYNCAKLVGDLTIPKGVVRIGSCAFSGETKEKAPKPGYVENLFVEALVTAAKDTSDETERAISDVDSTPAEQDAQEDGAGSVMLSEEKTADASGPEEDGAESEPPVTSDPEETASEPEPEPESESAPEAEPETEQKEIFTVTKIKEQKMGKESFFPLVKKGGVFICSEDNLTFQAAMKEAGYEKADSVVSATLNSGEGVADDGDLVKKLPVLGGKLVLPTLPPEFSAPKEEELFTYEFDGWTEQDDAANVVRKPGSLFPVGEKEELYFIANWAKVVKIAIEVRRVKNTATYSVPEIEGYEVLSYRWQTRKGEGKWTDVENATERQYSRKLQQGDGDRQFRCTITVKKRQNVLIQLFSAAQEEEIALAAAQSGLTELTETLVMQKADGVQTMKKTLSLPVSEAGSTYRITEAKLPDGFTFVDADEETLPADGKSFGLTLAPTGANWQETQTQVQVVSASKGKAASGADHLVQTGEDLVTNDAGTAELTVALQYNAAYETLTAGTVGLTLEETAEGEERNLVTVALALAEAGDVQQSANTITGRSFLFPGGSDAVVTQKGGLTAGFSTEFIPSKAITAAEMKLSLYQKTGTGTGKAVNFPSGTKIVLADLSGDTYSYYSYTVSGSTTSISLSSFSGYPGLTQAGEPVTEKLLFVFDFSGASASTLLPISEDYYLTLAYPDQTNGSEPAQAEFTVIAESTVTPSLTAVKTDDSDDALWGVQLNAVYSYPSGIWVQAALSDDKGSPVAFPSRVTVNGAQAIALNEDGSLQFAPQGNEIAFDFSNVPMGAMKTGTYSVALKMGPRPSLQNHGETSLAVTMAGKLEFTYTDKAPTAANARSLKVEADERLLDASEQNASLTLTITYENAQAGDTMQVEVLQKSATEDGEKVYEEQAGTMPITVSGYTKEVNGKGSFTVTLTAPKGKPSGTFRALVTMSDANGQEVAKEPYNFIVK